MNNYKNNKFKGLGYEFYGWVKRNYEFSIIILLAGLLEGSQRDDDLNFQKFIKNIENYGLKALYNLRYLHMPKSIDEVCLSKYYPRIYKPLVEAFPNYTNPKILSQPLFLSYIWFLYFEELLQYLL